MGLRQGGGYPPQLRQSVPARLRQGREGRARHYRTSTVRRMEGFARTNLHRPGEETWKTGVWREGQQGRIRQLLAQVLAGPEEDILHRKRQGRLLVLFEKPVFIQSRRHGQGGQK